MEAYETPPDDPAYHYGDLGKYMDERINKALKELKDAIRSCEDYKSFCAVKAEVDAEPELRRQIDDFRLRCFQLHNERADNPDFAELDRFFQESFEFRKNPLVDEYLKRELTGLPDASGNRTGDNGRH